MLKPISIERRRTLLKNLLNRIKANEAEIYEALDKDFKKPKFETFISEINFTIGELKNTISKLNNWTKPKMVWPSLLNFPSKEYIYTEPFGKVLIISPWNYPFQLSICPLVMAIAAGNRVVLKPSENSMNTSILVAKIINDIFENDEAVVILGDASLSENLLKQKWDKIFFTGSVKVGKIVAKAAAENMTPVILELGGKNPCIVSENTSISMAAKKIVWGKFLNVGQTCIAPDYILVHVKEKFNLIKQLKIEIEKAYSTDIENNKDYGRIINKNNFNRLVTLLEGQEIAYGGNYNENTYYLSPTLIVEPKLDSLLMKDEIFGPILPIISYESEKDLDKIIGNFEKPLSLYIFSNDNEFSKKIITKYSFGGGCINDCLLQFSNKRLPFGGVGESGNGSYHGKYGYQAFTHQKSIVKKMKWLDVPVRYAPYNKKLKKFKWFIEMMSKF
ncbi:MAG: aldehyde dehydrogenase family protein [Flavobacterium sp.]